MREYIISSVVMRTRYHGVIITPFKWKVSSHYDNNAHTGFDFSSDEDT